MLPILSLITKYADLVMIAAFSLMGFYLYLKKPSGSVCRRVYAYQAFILILFNLLSFALILLKSHDTGPIEYIAAQEGTLETFKSLIRSVLPAWLPLQTLWTILLYSFLMGGMYILLVTVYPQTNRFLWNCVFMLLSVGFIILWRLSPDSAMSQVYWIGIGFVIMQIVMLIFRGRWLWKIPSYVFAIASIGLIALPFVFPNEAWGALNWVQIGPISFQPSEFVKITFAFFLAVVYASERKKRYVLYTLAVAGVILLVLLIQRDLGALLILGILLWFMTYDYMQKSYILWGGLLCIAALAVPAYLFFEHVQIRFTAWLNPWSDVEGSGYQILQAMFAMADGGWLGTGLFRGTPGYIPVRTSDMIFAVIVEEMGGIFAIFLLSIYLLMFLFVMETGRRERNTFRRNLLISFGILFMTQTFIIVGGVIKLIPLTGVTLPFISYGGSSLVSNFITIAIIEAVIRLYRIDREEVRRREKQAEFERAAALGDGKADGPGQGPIQQPFEFQDPF